MSIYLNQKIVSQSIRKKWYLLSVEINYYKNTINYIHYLLKRMVMHQRFLLPSLMKMNML
ncbi:hypothetical protein DD594_26410 [Enterobacter cloacae complex sp. 4DZ1-17B1]|nr:hypothetical protein DD594_26410 [Enterobacter cloacae complex sp. 4DZ1-17B1]